jgi:adenine phosphoribosyltransferase
MELHMDFKHLIRDIPDFPKPGIIFKDITPVLADAKALASIVDRLAERYRGRIDAVVGIESRGFIVGAPLAYALGVGLTLVRKPGKLPYDRHTVTYELEYGSDALEIHTDALAPAARVLVADDLLATGGTALAAVELARRAGAEVVECAFIIELAFLAGAQRLAPVPSYSLWSFDGE